MLWTVLTELGRRCNSVEFVLDSKAPYLQKTKYNVLQKSSGFFSEIAKKQLARFGVVPESGITHFIDISGFAYGDFWGAKKAKRRLGRRAAAGRASIYMLPQAFGPFSDDDLVKEMQRICKSSKLVCARDAKSLDYLKGIGISNAELLPDITFALDVSDRNIVKPDGDYVCIIPNAKLGESGAMDNTDQIELYSQVADSVRASGLNPVIVLHEPKADKDIGEELSRRLEAPVLAPDDARDLKALIGGATAVVTSRFHGLVSALSTGVPAMAVGWSHKYTELLADFDCEELAFTGDRSEFLKVLDANLCDIQGRENIKNKLEKPRTEAKRKLEELFDRLARQIDS